MTIKKFIKIFNMVLFFIKYNISNFFKFIIIDTIPFNRIKKIFLKKFFLPNIGNNVVIMPKVRWFDGSNIRIGNNVFINVNTYLDDKGTIKIGNNTWIGCSVIIITANHIKENMEEIEETVFIGDYCWIGAGVIILPGVKINNNCIIGAGSVVTKDIPANSIAVGNPAKVIKERHISFPYRIPGGYIND